MFKWKHLPSVINDILCSKKTVSNDRISYPRIYFIKHCVGVRPSTNRPKHIYVFDFKQQRMVLLFWLLFPFKNLFNLIKRPNGRRCQLQRNSAEKKITDSVYTCLAILPNTRRLLFNFVSSHLTRNKWRHSGSFLARFLFFFIEQLTFWCKIFLASFFHRVAVVVVAVVVAMFLICIKWPQTNVLATVLITSCYLKHLQWPKLNCMRTLFFFVVALSLFFYLVFLSIQRPITNRMGSFLIRSHCNLFSSSLTFLSWSLCFSASIFICCFDWGGFYQASVWTASSDFRSVLWRGYNFGFH